MATFQLSGQVINQKSNNGIKSLKVQVWDKDSNSPDDKLAQDFTYDNGYFQTEFTAEDEKETPDIYFKIYYQDTLLKNTQDEHIYWNIAPGHTQIDTLKVDVIVVAGWVDSYDMESINQTVLVKIYDKGLGKEVELGQQSFTQPQGIWRGGYPYYWYHIVAPLSRLSYAGKPAADLIVRVFYEHADYPNAIATSPLILNALPEERLDLVVGEIPSDYQAPSEYQTLQEKLESALSDVNLITLTAQDIAVLANQTGTDLQQVNAYILAHYYHHERAVDVWPEIFYALFRQGLSTDLPALIAHQRQTLRHTLEDAQQNNIINSLKESKLSLALDSLHNLLVRELLIEEVPHPSSFPSLLQLAGLSTEQQQYFLDNYISEKDNLDSFWQHLRESANFEPEVVTKLQLIFQLGSVTQNYTPLISHLIENIGITTVRELVNLGVDQWTTLLTTYGVPETVSGQTEEEKLSNYLHSILHVLEDALPTATLAHHWSRDPALAGDQFNIFYSHNPEFNFAQANIAQDFAEQKYDLTDITYPEGFIHDLQALQRLFRLAPRYDKFKTIKTLWINNIRSAHAIKRMGPSNFIRTYSEDLGGRRQAEEVYGKANQIAALSLITLAKYGHSFNEIDTGVFQAPKLGRYPDWASLFAPLDFCDCRHCRSVLSPAAYLVDLLLFLREMPFSDDESTALDLFLSRRPEIAHIELSCENTHTPLPYIDLVNEVLENAIVPRDYYAQTSDQPALLQAQPEHFNPAVYEKLKMVPYPWQLPFDLTQTQAQIYLHQLGVERTQLMETLQGPNSYPTTVEIAAEYLAIAPYEKNLLAYSVLDTEVLKTYWGLPSNTSLDTLNIVAYLLQQAGLEYDELTQILKTHFIQADSEDQVEIHFHPDHPCDLAYATLSNLNNVKLDKIHRFIRLQRKLGWSVWELDKGLRAFWIENSIYDHQLLQLANVKRLQAQFNLPVAEILSWGAMLDTSDYPEERCLYEQVFLNPNLLINFPEIEAVFGLNQTRDNVQNPYAKLLTDPEITTFVLSALRLGEEDFTLLVEQEIPQPGYLDRYHLSHLYRVVSFTRALNLSISDFLNLKALTGQQPLMYYDFSSYGWPYIELEKTLEFIQTYRFIQQSGFSLEHLNYLLRHQLAPHANLLFKSTTQAQWLETLRTELLTQKNLVQQQAYLSQQLGLHFDLDPGLMEKLVNSYIFNPQNANQPALAVFLEEAFLHSTTAITAETFPAQMQTLERLGKFAFILNTLTISQSALPFLVEQGPNLGWLDLAQLPVSIVENAETITTTFTGWQRLVQVLQLNQNYFSQDFSCFDLLTLIHNEATLDTVLALLAQHTGWPLKDLQFLTGPQGFGFDFPQAYLEEKWLMRLEAAVMLFKKMGVSASQAWNWRNPELSFEQVYHLKQAVKAKYGETEWLALATSLQNQIREPQRDALLAYVKHTQNFASIEDIYAHYLIDPQMGACAQTSRIKQAVAAVQLFVQRVLMNLETDNLEITRDIVEEWKWRKNYRVWEANRKVFLYPENWIEPELRSDKSPFFQELENELLQGEITTDSAERAYLNYLQKLDEVSHLEVSGLYVDEERNILHVFARTANTPHKYYYRRWVDQAYWTAWEKVELDIEGDHLIPVVYNQRLYLFWALIKKESEGIGEDKVKESEKDEENKKPYKIQLAWSEYKQNQWTAKKISEVSIPTGTMYGFFFKGNGNSQLTIKTYNWKIDMNFAVGPIFYEEYSMFRMEHCHGVLNLVGEYERLSFGYFILPFIPEYIKENTYTGNYIEKMKFFSIHTIFTIFEKEGSPSNESEWKKILNSPSFPFYIIPAHQYRHFLGQAPFFYADSSRTFFIFPQAGSMLSEASMQNLKFEPTLIERKTSSQKELEAEMSHEIASIDSDKQKVAYIGNRSESLIIDRKQTPKTSESALLSTLPQKAITSAPQTALTLSSEATSERKYAFQTFYHPYTCTFIQQLNRYGLEGLLRPDSYQGAGAELLRQLTPGNNFDFATTYQPNLEKVDAKFPVEDIDFTADGAYSLYNWELFFHAPLLIATRLMQNQRFAEAQKWFHFIFDPTEVEGEKPHRFWKIKPFYQFSRSESPTTLQDLFEQLQANDLEVINQVSQWEADPFNPHLIARLRIVTYMKTVVMKYLDNLIAWADQLFRQDTLEALNEATQLYILAAQILGKPPANVASKPHIAQTFNDLANNLDSFSNAVVAIESALAPTALITVRDSHVKLPTLSYDEPWRKSPSGVLDSVAYFCIPPNDKLLGYWDTVADRLFKLRHCMNIQGQVRQLPLFAPPIDPALLVRARAAGLDISRIISDLQAPLPSYRFRVIFHKALELCQEVKAHGSALLAALEKRDSEALSRLRASHESQILKAMQQLKEKQIEEAETSLLGLHKSRELTKLRYDYYTSREYMNVQEKLQLELMTQATVLQGVGQGLEMLAGYLSLVPQTTIGVVGLAPVEAVEVGGSQIGQAVHFSGQVLSIFSAILRDQASQAAIKGNYDRRAEEWQLQADLANKELEQLDQQILVAEIRQAMAEQELENHQYQIEQAQEIETFMRDKYTDQELYQWMISQISSLYFQSYQMAYDLARQAEQCFQYELGRYDTTFIQFGYWDSLKKGLLAGERLHHDLRRLELAYLENHRRDYELTKPISLALFNPIALLQLRETGHCEVQIPEVLFDLDYPGQYMRRIKSVSLTIPCVIGPYTTVNCKLTLLNHRIRKSTDFSSGYAYTGLEDTRFLHDIIGTQAIATSNAQQDSGLFELNFQDERYLPFEGAGTISTWRLELPTAFRQFDYDTISDVILHIHYTAREGGESFKSAVQAEIQTRLNELVTWLSTSNTGLVRSFSLKRDFSNAFHQLLHPANGNSQNTILALDKRHIPYWLYEKNLEVQKIIVILKPQNHQTLDTSHLKLRIQNTDNGAWQMQENLGNLPFATYDFIGPLPGNWPIEVIEGKLSPENLEDILLLYVYTINK